MSVVYAEMTSPVGPLLVAADADTGALVQLHFFAAPRPEWWLDRGKLAAAAEQLEAYFAGDLTTFTLPVQLEGTAFQLAVWHQLQLIPYGETISYGELARRVGDPGAARAVGLANGANPVAIVVPCHRVIGAGGKLVGFGGGLDVKQRLLALERGERLLL